MKWWDINGRISFDVRPSTEYPAGWYRFIAPPGLKSLIMRSDGSIKIWIDGKPAVVKSSGLKNSSQTVELDKPIPEKSKVAIRIQQSRWNYGGSALPEPILLNCIAGIAQTGDWSQGSVLENYSGGAWYRKNIVLSEEQAASRVLIDLGNVVATAEVQVNGSLAGILVAPPWKIDITKWVKEGENRIEILVYNTLANHYLTIPTKYKGDSLKSGLLGPVKLEFETFVRLN